MTPAYQMRILLVKVTFPWDDHLMSVSTGKTDYVQPIVLLRAGTHEDAVRAAAVASVTAWVAAPDHPGWEPWLATGFAKSVRRAKPAQFEALRSAALSEYGRGDARALAFAPVAYDEMPRELGRLQVSGTDLERAGWDSPAPDVPAGTLVPEIVMNEGLGMTTGKACAQAAHALFVWAACADPDRLSAWVAAGGPVSVTGLGKAAFEAAADGPCAVVISDAGHTEIDPGSTTALVLAA